MTERPLTVHEHAAYLARLGLPPVRRPSATRLRALHRAHLSRVPFENFNRFLGRRISLETGALVHKLVTERRGGICFELNAGFAALLRAEGFTVACLAAQMSYGSRWTPAFDHLTLLVTLGSRQWLADAGYGADAREVVELTGPGRSLQVTRSGRHHRLLSRKRNGEWKAEYRFTVKPRRLHEFAGRVAWHQTAPEGRFVRHWICSRVIPAGRVRLFDDHFGVNDAKHVLTDARQLAQVLRQQFGLVIPVAKLKPWKLKRR